MDRWLFNGITALVPVIIITIVTPLLLGKPFTEDVYSFQVWTTWLLIWMMFNQYDLLKGGNEKWQNMQMKKKQKKKMKN